MTKPKGHKAKRITLNILLTAAILLVISATLSVTLTSREDAYLFGYKPYIITSESMEPAYKKHAVVLIKKDTYDQVQLGTVIAFKADKLGGKPAFHRVINITPQGLMTKGDANNLPDDQPITPQTFLGKETWHTNLTATLLPLLQTPKGLLYLILLPIGLITLLILAVSTLKKIRTHPKDPQQ